MVCGSESPYGLSSVEWPIGIAHSPGPLFVVHNLWAVERRTSLAPMAVWCFGVCSGCALTSLSTCGGVVVALSRWLQAFGKTATPGKVNSVLRTPAVSHWESELSACWSATVKWTVRACRALGFTQGQVSARKLRPSSRGLLIRPPA